VGNAVPPLLAEAIGRGLKQFLAASLPARALSPLPRSPKQAVTWLSVAVHQAVGQRGMRDLPMDEFKRAWFSLGYLHNWLHPDSVVQDDDRVVEINHDPALLTELAPEFAAPVYATSGWPVRLVPLAKEAARRFHDGRLRSDEYYCSQAQIAGWRWARKHSGDKWQGRDLS
jgi:DNA (cytosine-5)-methyltransferase 1